MNTEQGYYVQIPTSNLAVIRLGAGGGFFSGEGWGAELSSGSGSGHHIGDGHGAYDGAGTGDGEGFGDGEYEDCGIPINIHTPNKIGEIK